MPCLLMGLIALLTTPGLVEDSPRAEYEALVKEYDAACKSAVEDYNKAVKGAEGGKAFLQRPRPDEIAPRFIDLAEKHPDDPAALDALSWVAMKCIFGPQCEKALGILARDYSRSERLKEFCEQSLHLYGGPFGPYEDFLRAVLKNSPHRDVRSRACLDLATYLKKAKEKMESWLVLIALPDGLPQPWQGLEADPDFLRLKDRGLDKVAAESAALFQEVIDHYSDLRLEKWIPHSAVEFAKGELFELRNLGVGAKAQEIVGKDVHGKPMKLGDHRGRVVVLDFGSHRSCGACRQFYPKLREFVKQYDGKPVSLLGVSVEDDVKELQALYEKGELTWPMWWDGETGEGPLAKQWVILSMPTFYILDAKGVIRNRGFLQYDEITATVDMLLKEMSASKP